MVKNGSEFHFLRVKAGLECHFWRQENYDVKGVSGAVV